MTAVVQFAQYFFELLAERKRSPGDDLLSRLAQAEDDGTVLSETEMLSTCILLLVAGHETIANLLSGGTLALLRHPDQLERYRTDPERATHRIRRDAPLRVAHPTHRTGLHRATAEFGDVEFTAGDYAMLLIASANHDGDEFDDPEGFDITRTPNAIWDWDSAFTTASVPHWPAWRSRSHSPPCSSGHPVWLWRPTRWPIRTM